LEKSDYSPLFLAVKFRNGLQYRHSDFKSSSVMIWLYCLIWLRRLKIWWNLVL